MYSIGEECNGCWTPVIKFQFEDSNYIETLHWISGNSYAYTSVAKEMAEAKIYCTEMVGSKDLLDALNKIYEGKTINSEQASLTFRHVLPKEFPCK